MTRVSSRGFQWPARSWWTTMRMREILRSAVETGHTVRPYPSGNSLLADKDIDQLDCVIIDQKIPGLSGTDVLLEIDRRQLALPSVLITGAVDSEVTAAAQRLGAMTGDGQTIWLGRTAQLRRGCRGLSRDFWSRKLKN